ncbi:hypothetical protein C2S52_005403 [Perilla frutescens var. hirtella]|nr:hypothetical protein C2S51_010276 [Perilla frutescens var. frutescens]KAH6794926.1 hypothetical protein C2S52_005403 [Perilla frutescens var. hirtella]
MASPSFPFPVPVKHHRAPPQKQNCSATTTTNFVSFCSTSSFRINLHRPFPFFKRNSRFHRCYATSSPSEPPSNEQSNPLPGVSPKDTLQIFFAVLFWMSLFFWSCTWDRGNSGRPNKGPRFRK